MENKILVSAIVSIYKSEKFIEGLLEDLVNQTLYEKGNLEIVLVNSGSPENEETIIKSWQDNYQNIRYIKTEERESIYQAWNRGIRSAKGEFVTNANTDDRHRDDALEIMYNVFAQNPETDVVYANSLKTEIPNDTFYSATPKTGMAWIDFDPDLILFGCYLGPHPLWRKSLHDKFGYFDENLKVVGDYEYWLRIAKTAKFYHLNEFLGLYYYHSESAEHRDNSLTGRENDDVQKFYLSRNIRNNEELERIKEKVTFVANQIGNEQYKLTAFNLLEKRKKMFSREQELAKELIRNNDTPEEFNDEDKYCLMNVLEDLYKKSDILEDINFINLRNFVFSDVSGEFFKECKEVLDHYTKGKVMDNDSNVKRIEKLLDEGLAELDKHNFRFAKNKFSEILGISSNNIDALNNMSVAEAFLGNYEQSAKYIKKVFELEPENEIAAHNLNYLDSLVNEMSAPKDDNEQLHTAEELIEEGKLDDAEELLTNLINLDRKNLDALNDLSVIKILRGEYQEAVQIINSVLDEDSGNSTAIENLSTLESLVDQQLKDVRKQIKDDGNERS